MTTYNDDGAVIEDVGGGKRGLIKGGLVEHEEEGYWKGKDIKSGMVKSALKGVGAFCKFVFEPQ